MELPSFLPDELSGCQSFETAKDFIQAWENNPIHLTTFFEVACEDGIWAQSHLAILRMLLRWAAKAYYLNQLPPALAKRWVKAIQKHVSFLEPFLYFRAALFFTVVIQVEQKTFLVNSLLFGASSPFFNEAFRHHCFDHLRNDLTLSQISLPLFQLIDVHLVRGEIPNLWRENEQTLLALMYQSRSWGLSDLVSECEKILKRYLHRDNVLKTLLKAHQESFAGWKSACYEFFNQLEFGIRFIEMEDPSALKIQFLNFRADTLDIFSRLNQFVTHIGFEGDLSEMPLFGELLLQCPRLIGVDLSTSLNYTNQFDNLPEHLKELDLAACPWVSAELLQKASGRLKAIRRLDLANNGQLNYLSWGSLSRFPALVELKVARCYQLDDAGLRTISRSCQKLVHIDLEDCRAITDQGVIEIIHECRQLRYINLEGCVSITDKVLTEMAIYATQLSHLSLLRCTQLSDKGLLELVRLRASLREIRISEDQFSPEVLSLIRQQNLLLSLVNFSSF